MQLTRLFLQDLDPKKISVSESGKRAMFQPDCQSNEIILVLELDNSKSARKALGLDGDGAKCCDAMIYYCKELGKALLVLIELKGSDHDAAAEQLLSVYDKLRQERDWIKPHCRALIVSSRRQRFGHEEEMQGRFVKKGLKLFFGLSRDGVSCNLRKVKGLLDFK